MQLVRSLLTFRLYFLYFFVGPSTLDIISAPVSKRPDSSAATSQTAQSKPSYSEQLTGVTEFADYGPVLNSSGKPVSLTESETEYVVTCVKHLFKEHVVFQVSLVCLRQCITNVYSSTYQILSLIRSLNKFLSLCSLSAKRLVLRKTLLSQFQNLRLLTRLEYSMLLILVIIPRNIL